MMSSNCLSVCRSSIRSKPIQRESTNNISSPNRDGYILLFAFRSYLCSNIPSMYACRHALNPSSIRPSPASHININPMQLSPESAEPAVTYSSRTTAGSGGPNSILCTFPLFCFPEPLRKPTSPSPSKCAHLLPILAFSLPSSLAHSSQSLWRRRSLFRMSATSALSSPVDHSELSSSSSSACFS